MTAPRAESLTVTQVMGEGLAAGGVLTAIAFLVLYLLHRRIRYRVAGGGR